MAWPRKWARKRWIGRFGWHDDRVYPQERGAGSVVVIVNETSFHGGAKQPARSISDEDAWGRMRGEEGSLRGVNSANALLVALIGKE